MQVKELNSGEVFGVAAVTHFLRDEGVDSILTALAECGFRASRRFLEKAVAGLEFHLRSEIDGDSSEPLDYYFEEFSQLALPVRQILEAAFRLRPSGRVLDIGCGAGRFLKIFRERGYETTGIEVSDLLVWLCKKQGFGDVRRLGAEQIGPEMGLFDIQLLLGHNLGIGGTPEGVRQLLGTCARLASPGGLLLLSSIDMEASGEEYARRRVAHNQGHPDRHVGETEYWLEYGELKTPVFPWIHVKHEEIRAWAEPLGWELVELAFDPEEEGHWCGVMKSQGR